MKKNRAMNYSVYLIAGISLFLFSGCSTLKSADRPAAVEELHAGILAGYLAQDERPDSLKLLPPPPAPDTAAFARDEEIATESFALRGTARWQQAIKDADLHFPAAAEAFTEVLGFQISEDQSPFLYQLLRRSLSDAGLSSYTAKNHYQRQRPFMLNGQPIGTPEDEDLLRKDGSYPSGHTAIGWAWALLLCEIVPERSDAILKRGYDFGQSRVICNVHWQSDVDAGRIMAAAAVACLHTNPVFQNDLEAAKREVRKLLPR